MVKIFKNLIPFWLLLKNYGLLLSDVSDLLPNFLMLILRYLRCAMKCKQLIWRKGPNKEGYNIHEKRINQEDNTSKMHTCIYKIEGN